MTPTSKAAQAMTLTDKQRAHIETAARSAEFEGRSTLAEGLRSILADAAAQPSQAQAARFVPYYEGVEICERCKAVRPEQAQAAEAPLGWRLVPSALNGAMAAAYREYFAHTQNIYGAWTRMLDAAPTPPASPVASEHEGNLPKLPSHIINAIIDYGNSRADRRDGEANSDLKYVIGAIRSLLATHTGSK